MEFLKKLCPPNKICIPVSSRHFPSLPASGPYTDLFQIHAYPGWHGSDGFRGHPSHADNTSLPQVSANTEDAAISDKGSIFAINFSSALREIINETKYMEQLGFPVPELARNVALQEDKFLR